jgi:hypothetical protein
MAGSYDFTQVVKDGNEWVAGMEAAVVSPTRDTTIAPTQAVTSVPRPTGDVVNVARASWGLMSDQTTAGAPRAAGTRTGAVDLADKTSWPDPKESRIWVSAAESCTRSSETPEWLIEGYLTRGAITELTAKPKVGKTHFTLDAVRALLAAKPFLECATTCVPVLYLTEEREPTFTQALKRLGLEHAGQDQLAIIYRHEVRGWSWPAIGEAVLKVAAELDSGLVVCDTLPDWASLGGDAENNAGAALEAMRPLQALAAAKLAVLVLRHERKSGGELGDSARGSSAFAGAADVLMTLRRKQGQGHPNQRVLEAVGRFSDIAPQRFVELRDDHYVDLGDSAAVAMKEALRICEECLPRTAEEAVTLTWLEGQADEACRRPTLQRALKALEEQGVVKKDKGAGSASPRQFGYWLGAEVGAQLGGGV